MIKIVNQMNNNKMIFINNQMNILEYINKKFFNKIKKKIYGIKIMIEILILKTN